MALKALDATTDDEHEHVTGEVVDQRAPTDDDEDFGVYLSASDIMGMSDVVTQTMLIPEWSKNGKSGKIVLKSLEGAQRDAYLNSIQYVDKQGRQRYDLKGSNARLLVLSAVRPDGQPMFNRHQADALNERNAAVLERIAKKVRAMSGLDNTDDDDDERRKEGLD